MKKRLIGIDALRGLGIMVLLILHTAFYFYDGIYDVDLDNPSLIVTLIGFLLMFAGLFAMISGLVYSYRYETSSKSHAVKLRHMGLMGLSILLIAYLYFLFTGPGLIDFENRRMDESIIVALINQGTLITPSLERVLYVDSLIMIGLNILLLALLMTLFKALNKRLTARIYFILAFIFLAISLIRIPLYEVYLDLIENESYGRALLLNFFVNKNNPIFPFFSFALFGGALGVILKDGDFLTLKKAVTMISPILIIVGIIGYILTPPTMLDRAIDPTWYFIMVMQCGLFMALITLFIKLYDTKTEVSKGAKILLPVFTRFGTFSLTAFFFESVLSALLFKTVSLFIEIQLSMAAAILYGVFMVFVWNGLLTFIQKHHPTWSIEYLISKFVNHFTYSHKLKKVMKSDDFD